MRVLMFGWEFPPHITGGLGTACYGLTQGLLKSNVEIIFVVPKAYGDEKKSEIRLVSAENIEVSRVYSQLESLWKRIKYLEISSNIVPYVDPEEFRNIIDSGQKESIRKNRGLLRNTFRFSGKYGRDLLQEVTQYAVIAATLAQSEHFDIIHAHDWLTFPAGIAAKTVSGKPLVIHVHATEFDRSGEQVNRNVYEIERRGMVVADRIIAVSNYTRNIIINRYGIPANKVITVHNAVDFTNHPDEEFTRSISEKVVTFLGRVTFQKGPDYFVEAAYKVLKRNRNVRFVMAGSGDMLYRMIRRVAQLGIADRFHFTGFLKGNDVNRMFMLSDVYVMPSVSEPFGISPLEAMRSNVPVIISKQSGVSEVLKYAIKVDFWDVDALADSIYGLINYKALSNFFISHGQLEVNNLKWENAARKVTQIYHSLTSSEHK